MEHNNVVALLNRLVDGMAIRVRLKSGSRIVGVYDQERSGEDAGLYFENMDGRLLRADWGNVEDVSFASTRSVVGDRFIVPPNHPLAPDRRPDPDSEEAQIRALFNVHTSRGH